MQQTRYASIILPVPVSGSFTYIVPAEFEQAAGFGRRALVPFGKRVLTGFIVDITGSSGDVPPSKLKPIMDIVDDEPVFDRHMLDLAEWTADYYIAAAGEVLKAAMPYGTMVKSRLRVHALPFDDTGAFTDQQRDALDLVREHDGSSIRALERIDGSHLTGILRTLERRGAVRIEREITTPAVRPHTERHVFPLPDPPAPLSTRAREQQRCATVVHAHPDGIPLEELLERFSFSRGVVNAVVDAGHAEYREVEVARRSKLLDQEALMVDHPLTDEQAAAVKLIQTEAQNEKPRPVLLRGVTGSGKTRVYIEIVRSMLDAGRGAIILVPEISLTPQTTRFFNSVFPGRVAVMHSAMSPGERHDMWRCIHDGGCDVVIGPRSAVFAPLRNPGVIVVDEEHDASYKQTDNAPRYHARDVAVMRASMLGIPAILGSATPSLESWHNASTGKYALATLEKRVRDLPLPEVVVADMRRERGDGNLSSLSRRFREELTLRIERGEKSIVLINRRGHSTGIQCRSCGNILACPRCSVGLTFHSSKGLAVCHLCGHEQLVLEHCPVCGSTDLKYSGAGTQRIERELESVTGPGGIIRMDSDTTRAHDAHHRLLEEFRTGSTPVLLGTQMVAKGLDIPSVTLVGIVSADSSLYLPDFRAGERTFQLITQVAGRAGRGDTPGMVVLQTWDPDNDAVNCAAVQDYETFAEHELVMRREVNFPPYSRLVLVELGSPDSAALDAFAATIAGYLSEHLDPGAEIMGPIEPPIARIRGRHRRHILLKSARTAQIRAILRHIMDNLTRSQETLDVDVDPIDLM